MTEATTRINISLPSAEEYAAAFRKRLLTSYALCAAVSALLAAVYLFAFRNISLLGPLVLLILMSVPVLMWLYPKFAAYTLVASACLFETAPLNWPDAFTDHVPFFWNINSVIQFYAGLNFHGIPLNVVEFFLVVALSISAFRTAFTRRVSLSRAEHPSPARVSLSRALHPSPARVSLRSGPLLWPIAAYMAFVGWGWLHGMLTDGDFRISLQEVRSQFYFFVAYLMAVNLVRKTDDVRPIQWIMVLSIGLKGILYTVRRLHYITFGGMVMPDQGIGSHEEAFFFDCFILLLLVCLICDVYPKLRRVMWLLLPFVLMGDLACNRRAATAAFIVVIPILLLAAYRALPNRRRLVGWISFAIVAGFSVYYPLYKDRGGMLAQPARAVRSQFDPDPRDLSSNNYRVAEEGDLYATIKSSPLTGYGYGKRMLHAVPIADISKTYDWWDIITHNQILWVWMRVGTVGFIAFWLMIASILVASARIVRDERSSREAIAAALFAMLVVSALLIFGLLDLQLSNFRDMIFAGFVSGAFCLGAVSTPARGARL